MLYVTDITTNASTSQNSAKRTDIKVTDGEIVQMDVFFPYGAQGLHHIQVWEAGHPIAPATPTTSLAGDNIHITGPMFYMVSGGVRTLNIYSWNDDTCNAHTVTVRFWFKAAEPEVTTTDTQGILSRIRSSLGLD